MARSRPIPDSYWVSLHGLPIGKSLNGQLLAGEYPGAKQPDAAYRKLARFLDVNVEMFIDLTEPGEYDLRPYASMLAFAAGERKKSVIYERQSVADMETPSPEKMVTILDTIDTALQGKKTVYVHCYGGIGRTGTVIGCWLVRHGLTGRQALAKIASWRRHTPDGWRQSPETPAQRQMVLEWEHGR